MSPRELILARIRSRIGSGDSAMRTEAVDGRLTRHVANLIPARGQGDLEHRIRVFTQMMEQVGGTVEVLDDLGDVPEATAAYLRSLNLPARIRRGADPKLVALPWHRAATIEVEEGPAIDSDKASLTRAFGGVAESGTIIQLSGPDNPTSLSFLPDAHVVVLETNDLHASYEEAWAKLRLRDMPRSVNMISGPSRTGDIEQTIVRPAHGPKNMHVMIVRNAF